MKKLVGRTDIEDALNRLDQLTRDEVGMAAAQGLKATHEVDDKIDLVKDLVIDEKKKQKLTERRTPIPVKITAAGWDTCTPIKYQIRNNFNPELLGNLPGRYRLQRLQKTYRGH